MASDSNLNANRKLPVKFELNTKGKSYLLGDESSKESLSFENLKTLIFDATLSSLLTVPRRNENVWYTCENFENLQSVFVLFAQNLPLSEYREHSELFNDSLNLFDYKFNYHVDFDATSSVINELCKVPVNGTNDGNGELPASVSAASSSSTPKTGCTKLDLVMSKKDMVTNGYPLSFKKTKDCYANVTENSPMFAIDCEMVQTVINDRALARISLVDENFSCLYDTYVKPKEQITNYLTKFSGIRRDTLRYCNVTLQDVQQKIRNLLPDNAILVGHSLQSDLKAMEMTHPYVIDTSTIYNLSGAARYKPSLKQLASELLGQNIQQRAHCSIEDAKTTMKLVQLKLSKGILFGDRVNRIIKDQKKSNPHSDSPNYHRSLSYYMKKLSVNSAVIATAMHLYRFEFGNLFTGFSCDSFANLVTEAKRVLDRNYRNVIGLANFMRQIPDDSTKHLDDLNVCLKEIWTRIASKKSLCIVIFTEPGNNFKSGCFMRFSSGCFETDEPLISFLATKL